MSHTLKELADNPNLLDDVWSKPEPKEHTGKVDCCEDCYYEEFGNFIEENPIGGGGIRRG